MEDILRSSRLALWQLHQSNSAAAERSRVAERSRAARKNAFHIVEVNAVAFQRSKAWDSPGTCSFDLFRSFELCNRQYRSRGQCWRDFQKNNTDTGNDLLSNIQQTHPTTDAMLHLSSNRNKRSSHGPSVRPSSQEPCPANVINLRKLEGTLQFLILTPLSDLPIVIPVS